MKIENCKEYYAKIKAKKILTNLINHEVHFITIRYLSKIPNLNIFVISWFGEVKLKF